MQWNPETRKYMNALSEGVILEETFMMDNISNTKKKYVYIDELFDFPMFYNNIHVCVCVCIYVCIIQRKRRMTIEAKERQREMKAMHDMQTSLSEGNSIKYYYYPYPHIQTN